VIFCWILDSVNRHLISGWFRIRIRIFDVTLPLVYTYKNCSKLRPVLYFSVIFSRQSRQIIKSLIIHQIHIGLLRKLFLREVRKGVELAQPLCLLPAACTCRDVLCEDGLACLTSRRTLRFFLVQSLQCSDCIALLHLPHVRLRNNSKFYLCDFVPLQTARICYYRTNETVTKCTAKSSEPGLELSKSIPL